MAKHTLEIQQIFQSSLEETFDFFSSFTNFEKFWPGKFKRIVDGQDPKFPYGLGAVREIDTGLIKFEETIISYKPNHHIQYTISKNNPFKDYTGTMEFFALSSNETLLRHTMELTPKVPGTFLLEKAGVELIIKRGIKKAALILSNR